MGICSSSSLQAENSGEVKGAPPFLLLPRWHAFNFVAQLPPIIGLQLGVLDTLLTPVLVQVADMILTLLEVN